MSRLFDVLRRRDRDRASSPKFAAAESTPHEKSDRRCSRRRTLDIPVYIYAHEEGQDPCHEEAHTLNVNAQGALLLLSVPVYEGQQLVLTNALTEQDQDCRIVRLGARRARTVEVGVAFPHPNPSFWPLPKDGKDGSGAD